MSDIVERLRSVQQLGYRTDIGETCNEAAFEIIRLLKALEEAAKVADQYVWDDHALAQATNLGKAVHHQSVEIAAAIRALQPEER